MTNNSPTIPYSPRCPDCGRRKKTIFIRNENGISKKNIHCKCYNSNNGLGHDLIITNKKIDKQKMIYIQLTSSGIENQWQKNHLWCPVCGYSQFPFKSVDSGINQKCKNLLCPAIGFDYQRNNNTAIVVASGIKNDITNFMQNQFHKFFPNIQLDRFSI